jgi:hypothetical protein
MMREADRSYQNFVDRTMQPLSREIRRISFCESASPAAAGGPKVLAFSPSFYSFAVPLLLSSPCVPSPSALRSHCGRETVSPPLSLGVRAPCDGIRRISPASQRRPLGQVSDTKRGDNGSLKGAVFACTADISPRPKTEFAFDAPSIPGN